MPDLSFLEQLPAGAEALPEPSMQEYTTFQLGGPVPALIDCRTPEALSGAAALLVENGVKYMVIGQGSNLLVSDAGLEAVVLRYCTENSSAVSVDGCRVTVDGCVLLDDFVRLTIDHGLGDVSFCSGIPGTVGGAIAGNAGAFGQQIGDVLESAVLLERDGLVREVTQADLGFAYRHSALKQTGGIVLKAVLKLKACDIETMSAERERILELRRTKHPDWKQLPCAGSVFRNIEPTSAAERRQAAGWFLEQAGAKDFRIGGARLYEKHANIVIAEKEATARDVYLLTEKMIEAVRDKFGFDLEREIKLIGEF
jgi:UDP-N-acetylmuramate dehydrogenase